MRTEKGGHRSDSYLFPFEPGEAVLPAGDVELLGRKGANLARMCRLGLPVPPGFTISTALCRSYLTEGRLPDEFPQVLAEGVARLERLTGKTFGAPRHPLLVSARSGAAVSMPGMLSTVLNVGLTERSVEGLARLSGNPRFALDSFRRLIAMYGEVVCGIPRSIFDSLLSEAKEKAGVVQDYELDAKSLADLVDRSLGAFRTHTGRPFPQDPYRQLCEAVEGVFRSWESDPAKKYRSMHDLEGLRGTAVTIQVMVFGNSGGASGTGVAFTRNPVRGERELYVDFLYNAQGEDLVAGIRTPESGENLKRELPEVSSELARVAGVLEREFKDMQDIEFTVEDGKLFLLQCREGKRSSQAALKIACDMAAEGLISKREALKRLRSLRVEELRVRKLSGTAQARTVGHATVASGGTAAGRIALSSEQAVAFSNKGEPVVLVREETSAADIAGMAVSAGILTTRGGRTSHAAVVARHRGITCLVGCGELRIHQNARRITLGTHSLSEGDWITLDGSTGTIYQGRLPSEEGEPPPELELVSQWIKEQGERDHPLAPRNGDIYDRA